MSNPYVGEIRMFGGNFAPAGWKFCDGSLLPISEFETLFNLIGTTYGGDGQSTFALPDLRGRVPRHQGQDSRSPRVRALSLSPSRLTQCRNTHMRFWLQRTRLRVRFLPTTCPQPPARRRSTPAPRQTGRSTRRRSPRSEALNLTTTTSRTSA